MKIIKDIRLYKSAVPNVDGNAGPSAFGNRPLNLTATRVVMKLREFHFSLGTFDHLYLNFTNCLPEGVILPAQRTVDSYHPFFRYYDIGINQALFEKLDSEDTLPQIYTLLKQTLIMYFAPDEDSKKAVEAAVEEAVTKGSELTMRFKEKTAAKTKAVIYLKLLDNAYFLPILCVYDLSGKILLQENLPQTIDFCPLGEIQLSSKKVTVKPRKNVFAQSLKPITFLF